MLHGVLQLFLVQDVRMALDTVGAPLVHKLISQVQVGLVQLNHIVRGLEVLIFRFLV